MPLAHEIKPDIIIVVAAKADMALVEKLSTLRKDLPEFGLVYMAPTYALQDEIFCYTHSVDHYLLAATPFASVLSRLQGLRARVLRLRKETSRPVTHLPQAQTPHVELEISGVVIRYHQNVAFVDGAAVQLAPIERRLLQLFLTHPDRAFPRADLKRLVWKDKKISSRSIDAHISKLKKSMPQLKDHLINIYGLGYSLVREKTKLAA